MDPVGIARLFHGAAPPGHAEDNGALLDLILHSLPADRLQVAAAASLAMAQAAIDVAPGECRLPLVAYLDALEAGHMPALEWYWTTDGARLHLVWADWLAVPMDTRVNRAALDNRQFRSVSTILAAHGHLVALQRAFALGCPAHDYTGAHAAENGHLAILQWLLDCQAWKALGGNIHAGAAIFIGAARGGLLAVLQWARDNEPLWARGGAPHPLWPSQAYHSAASRGYVEVLQWLHADGHPWLGVACSGAAKGGHLGVLQWLRDQGCPWGTQTCSYAAWQGHLDVLTWARAQDPPCPWDSNACTRAAEGGHLEVLQWLHGQGCPWGSDTFGEAIKGGHLGVLQWAHAHGCPYPVGPWVCMKAARLGRIDILTWARDQGWPWDQYTCAAAAKHGHFAALQWACANGCPWGDVVCSCAAAHGRLEILQWLRAQEPPCPWSSTTLAEALVKGQNNTEVIQWFRENGCPEVPEAPEGSEDSEGPDDYLGDYFVQSLDP